MKLSADANAVVDRNPGGDFKLRRAFWPFAQRRARPRHHLRGRRGMAVLRGVTRQSVSAFRLVADASAIHAVLRFPTVVGTLAEMERSRSAVAAARDAAARTSSSSRTGLDPSGALGALRARRRAARSPASRSRSVHVPQRRRVPARLPPNAERPSMLANPLAAQGGGADGASGRRNGAHDSSLSSAINTNAGRRDYEPKPGN